MSKNVKIIGLVATFCISAIGGFLLPIEFVEEQLPETKIEEPAVSVVATVKTEEPIEPIVVEQQDSVEIQEEIPAAPEVDVTPRITGEPQVWPVKNSYLYQMAVTAEVESGDPLECVVKTNENSADIVAKASFKDGKAVVLNIPPVDGGTYYVSVVNTVSQSASGVLKSGFNKMAKWSKEEITKYLNAENTPKDFYLHFVDLSSLKIRCVAADGVENAEAALQGKVDLTRLRTDRGAYGWTLTVSETPQYDKFNRISQLTINITQN